MGLAAARAIAGPDRTICLLERHPRPGMETSTHNSGVIHAGIYYPAGSLKAGCASRACGGSTGTARRERCPTPDWQAHPCRATKEADLSLLLARGQANGVEDLELVDVAFRDGASRTCGRCPHSFPRTPASSKPRRWCARSRTIARTGMSLCCPARSSKAATTARDVRAEDSARSVSDAGGRQRRGPLCRRRVERMLGGEAVPDLSVARRVRRAGAIEATAGKRPRLSASRYSRSPGHAT